MMVPPLETYVIVALAFAVFAAVTSVGAAIVLGVGYERIRAGLERVKEGLDVLNRQTGFFSTAIYKLENRVDGMDAGKARIVVDDGTPVKPARALRKPRVTKSRAKKNQADAVSVTTLMVQDTEGHGGIVATVSDAANDWQSYQGLTKDEALANFAQSRKVEGKVRFM